MLINHSFCTPIGAVLKNDSFTYNFCDTSQTSKYTNLAILEAWVQSLPIVQKALTAKTDWSGDLSFFLVSPNSGLKLTSETSISWRLLSKES